MNPKRAVFLVGFMGAGKTTTGRALATRLGWQFLDLDDLIEQRERRTVAEIFAASGEPEFRRVETAALEQLLRELPSLEPTVVALGGGAFVQPANAVLLKQFGAPVVFLDAPVDELDARCVPRAGQRPLFRDAEQFRRLYEERRSGYVKAGLRLDTSGKSADEVALELIVRLGLEQ